MEFISTWQFNVAAYVVSIVFYFQFNRIAVRRAKDDAAATIVLQAIAAASILVLVPFFPISFPTKIGFYGLLLLASVFYAINDRLQTPIRKHLQVSVYSILYQMVFVFLFIYGVQIFKEEFVFAKMFGVLLIMSASVLLFFKRGELRFSKYVLMAMIAPFALATAIIIDVGVSREFNLPIYIALSLVIPGIFIMCAEKVTPTRLLCEVAQSNIRPYLIAGAAFAATIFFSLRSLQLGDVTTVSPIQSLTVLLNVAVAYIFLKERDNIFRKLAAAGLAVCGAVFVTIS